MPYTDVDADCSVMMDIIGLPNSYFYPIWTQFASGALWDGQSCSEIACCVSYMAGNLSKIYVSNYAQGLYSLFSANGRAGTSPSKGAFIWFDYDNDNVPDHTGRVYDVDNNSQIITTVEGNVGGLVVMRYYTFSDPTIFAYGYPNYDGQPAPDPTPIPPDPEKTTYQNKYKRRRYIQRWT